MMTDSGVSRRITNGWLDWLGGKERKSLFVGNTNFLHDMDAAALRPGRVDEIVLVLPPDAQAREAIFNIHTSIVRKMPVDPKDFNVAKLSEETFMWNGAEIEQACIDAAHKAFEEEAEYVVMSYFSESIKNHKVNIEKRIEDVKAYVAELKATQRYNESFLKQAQEEFFQGSQKAPEADRVKAMFD